MILKETILSAFTERGTLLKWLKKVEAALNADVLTDISVEQIDETHVKLKFTFENGAFVESPVLTLARGKDGDAASIRVGRVTTGEATTPASVVNVGTESAAVLDFVIPRGRDGLDGEGIAATVEVGTVTTGAAGTSASVVNVGNEQRAVLNFVIPRGDPGESGSAGVGFDVADEISINDGEIHITADDNGVNIAASFEVAVGEEILEIPSTMYLPFKGSESIVIDVDESGDFVEIHLDADIAAKLGRVLVTPMSAPASTSLVAVDNTNAQTMLTVGDGLTIEGGALKATGGGGGASGLYKHNISIATALTSVDVEIVNTRQAPYTDAQSLFDEGIAVTIAHLDIGDPVDGTTCYNCILTAGQGESNYVGIYYTDFNSTTPKFAKEIVTVFDNVTVL